MKQISPLLFILQPQLLSSPNKALQSLSQVQIEPQWIPDTREYCLNRLLHWYLVPTILNFQCSMYEEFKSILLYLSNEDTKGQSQLGQHSQNQLFICNDWQKNWFSFLFFLECKNFKIGTLGQEWSSWHGRRTGVSKVFDPCNKVRMKRDEKKRGQAQKHRLFWGTLDGRCWGIFFIVAAVHSKE